MASYKGAGPTTDYSGLVTGWEGAGANGLLGATGNQFFLGDLFSGSVPEKQYSGLIGDRGIDFGKLSWGQTMGFEPLTEPAARGGGSGGGGGGGNNSGGLGTAWKNYPGFLDWANKQGVTPGWDTWSQWLGSQGAGNTKFAGQTGGAGGGVTGLGGAKGPWEGQGQGLLNTGPSTDMIGLYNGLLASRGK